ncbi:MAG: 2Fe-2S iron-sulfur cluster-binding protein [Bacteroidota bacterium]
MEITINVKDREGVTHKLHTPIDRDTTIMDLCKAHDLPVEGLCGGMATCATCQCYIISSDITLPEMSADEEAMLSETFYSKDNSRLGCQIPITAALDGLEIELVPE